MPVPAVDAAVQEKAVLQPASVKLLVVVIDKRVGKGVEQFFVGDRGVHGSVSPFAESVINPIISFSGCTIPVASYRQAPSKGSEPSHHTSLAGVQPRKSALPTRFNDRPVAAISGSLLQGTRVDSLVTLRIRCLLWEHRKFRGTRGTVSNPSRGPASRFRICRLLSATTERSSCRPVVADAVKCMFLPGPSVHAVGETTSFAKQWPERDRCTRIPSSTSRRPDLSRTSWGTLTSTLEPGSWPTSSRWIRTGLRPICGFALWPTVLRIGQSRR